MSKKSHKSSGMALGRILIKSQITKGKKRKVGDSMLHTAEIQDGSDFNRINFTSVTEQNDLDDFLSIAELAGTDFTAEKLNVTFARPALEGILTAEEKEKVAQVQDENRAVLRIPRRPAWDRSTSPQELAQLERESFLLWRRSLALLHEKEGVILTPYEKNLEFWRQLWRVIERSDVVVQIVDARDPLLFYCEDLQNYITEVSDQKEFLLLVNKADFLTEVQRDAWAKYFLEKGINAVFYSALVEDTLEKIEEEDEEPEIDITDLEVDLPKKDDCEEDSIHVDGKKELENAVKQCEEDIQHLAHRLDNLLVDKVEDTHTSTDTVCEDDHSSEVEVTYEVNTSHIFTHIQLINFFRHFHNKRRLHPGRVTIGFVGYPNVGKSSTINTLMAEKKVSVSATPGKTKHFQTLFLTEDILLCDCPGLVFPAFVTVKAEMIISGILPIDQMRDHVAPMNIILGLIPRYVYEGTYGVDIPRPLDGEDPDRVPTSEEFLSTYGFMRGYMTPRGIPDHPRSARYILKDYVCGKLLYCHCPPGSEQDEYHTYEMCKIKRISHQGPTPQMKRNLYRPGDNLDNKFFDKTPSTPHFKGSKQVGTGVNAEKEVANQNKPWIAVQRTKRKSKQKLRVKYSYLDD